MGKERLLAMSDGVFAIIITIMVLELKVPEGATLQALLHAWPVFLAYALSFIYVAIYWNNHHHYFHLVDRVNGGLMWANFHLLFWLSLIPFATGWMGEHAFAPWPTAVYGISLVLPAAAWRIMEAVAMRAQGDHSRLAQHQQADIKSLISTGLYLAGVALSFVAPLVSLVCYFAVALLWLMPDKRIERLAAQESAEPRP
jgi:uncharacterized membrane protein